MSTMTAADSMTTAIRDAALLRMEREPDSVRILASFLRVDPRAVEQLKDVRRWELPLALMVAEGLSISLKIEAE